MIQKEIVHAKLIGYYFLLAFLVYGFGRNFFEADSNFLKFIGAVLIILNSIIVMCIGFFFLKTLRLYNSLVGKIYLLSRVLEGIFLSSLVLTYFVNINIPSYLGYFIAMILLGLGSIPMCFILYKHQICPRWLAVWGLIGYTIFALGFIIALFGKPWSIYFLPLGGLWEITFSLWLIFKANSKIDQA